MIPTKKENLMLPDTFYQANIHFSYSRFGAFPQIPYTQDVLYVLHLSGEQDAHNYYNAECDANWSTYIENLMLVAAAVASQVLNMERYDEVRARQIIAQAILDLTRARDKCLFNNALAEAAEVVTGKSLAPSRTGDREQILAICGCAGCKEIIRDCSFIND